MKHFLIMFQLQRILLIIVLYERLENVLSQTRNQISSCNATEYLCIDKYKVLKQINCVNGKWSPSKQCESFQQLFQPKCLNGDDFYAGYCIHIREPQRWSKDIPVYEVEILNQKNLRTINEYLKTKQISQFWLPVKRLEKYGRVGWTIPKHYHEKFGLPIQKRVPDYVSHDCVFYDYDAQEIWLRNCSEKHWIIHIYKPESRYFAYTSSWHYSTSNTNGYYIGKKCQYVAEPKTEEDNFIIKRLVERKGQECRIGVEINEAGTYVWSSSKTPINFTDWVRFTDFSNTVVVMTKDGWTLQSSSSPVECSVCQVDYTKYKTEVSVGLSENQTQLMVLLTNTGIKQFSLRVESLDDFTLGATYTKFNVYNDFTNSTIKFLRNVSYITSLSSQSNIYYFDYIHLPIIEEMRTTKVFLPRSNISQEYSCTVEIKKLCYEVICDPNINYNLYKSISDLITQLLKSIQIIARVIKIIDINNDGDIKMLLRLYTSNNENNNYKIIKNELNKLNKSKYRTYFLSVDNKSLKFSTACLPEETKQNNCTFKWRYTDLGNTYVSNCKNLFISRKCEGNYIDGATWGKYEMLHYSNMNAEKTMKIVDLYNYFIKNSEKVTPNEAVEELSNITASKTDIEPLDLHYISAIYKNIPQSKDKIVDQEALATNTSLLISNLLASKIKSMDESDLAVASANDFVKEVEHILPQITKKNTNENGTKIIVEDNFVHVMINPFVRNISGIAFMKPSGNGNPSFKEYNFLFIYANTNITDIISKEDLEMATYVPQKLFQNIYKYANDTARISINLFYNDTLFVQNSTISNRKNTHLVTKILDVSILGYSRFLYSPLPIIAKTVESSCGYWDFGTEINKVNQWKEDNIWYYKYYDNINIQICYFGHLTNFAMLLGNKVGIGSEKGLLNMEEHNNLQYITAAGCLLSIFGICGIGFTALMFNTWRQKIGSKVVLNVCICILLQMILLYTNFNYSDAACAISGSLLHYSVLCGFSWSLVMAILHYLKFVKVIGPQTPHLLLKTSVVGWGLPIIPVASAVTYNYLTIGQYLSNLEHLEMNICYPQGIVLHLSLLLPIGLIVCTNSIIFLIVLYNVAWRPNIRNTLVEKQMLIQQIKLAVFLFFLLGLTWISGLLAVLVHSKILIYFFSATASLQGFILFLFYIIFDHSTRGLWLKKLQPATSSKKRSGSDASKDIATSMSDSTDWITQVQTIMRRIKFKPTGKSYTSV